MADYVLRLCDIPTVFLFCSCSLTLVPLLRVFVTDVFRRVPNLSCRGLCDQFTFHFRVFMTCISLSTLCGDFIYVCVCHAAKLSFNV